MGMNEAREGCRHLTVVPLSLQLRMTDAEASGPNLAQ
jgi:hypothetical protein